MTQELPECILIIANYAHNSQGFDQNTFQNPAELVRFSRQQDRMKPKTSRASKESEHAPVTQSTSRPIVVDLDGTLLRSDLLIESFIAFVRKSPRSIFLPLIWLARGKANLKSRLAHAVEIDAGTLPYDSSVLEMLKSAKDSGRKVVLATASNKLIAENVASSLGLFDDVLASDSDRNLSSHAKKDALVETYGESGFDYIGDSVVDLPVWQSSREAHVVSPSFWLRLQLRKRLPAWTELKNRRATLRDWIFELRLHQWVKNLLIFVPPIAAHQITNVQLGVSSLVAFLSFGLCASAVYVINDMFDLPSDRAHAKKRSRPLAAGHISIKSALLTIPILLVTSLLVSLLFLPPVFFGVLFLYLLTTFAYSISVKQRMVIDVVTLAGLYTLRIVAGAFATGLPLSFWILAFSMFMFLSLALVKRYAELHQISSGGKDTPAHGRGYWPDDLSMISSLGAASAYTAVLVLALYINDETAVALYRHPEVIWFACPLLLLWISRVWMLAHRGLMHDDPIIFAIRDKISLTIGAMFATVFWLAS